MDPTVPPPPSWSGLQADLLLNIANRLDCRLDRLRFRAVCNYWRSILPLPNRRLAPPSPPLRLPFPMSPNPHINPRRRGYFKLLESTVYCIQPLKKVSDAWKTSKCWLIRIEETDELGKVRLKDPLSVANFKILSGCLEGGLNLLDYRVSEVTKLYGLRFVDCGGKLGLNPHEMRSIIASKVVVCSEGASFAVMAVHPPGQLSIWRMGDKKWTVINDGRERAHYEDAVYCNGKFYAVDYSGLTIAVDLSLNITQVAPAMPRSGYDRYGGCCKYLVNSMGDVFLLDRDFDLERGISVGSDSDSDNEDVLPTIFNVYKLNEEKLEWVPVKSLGDRVMFVGDGDNASFSVSAKDFPGCKSNCIYYTVIVSFDLEDHHHPGCVAALYDMEDCSGRLLSTVHSHSGLFWPPPSWVMTGGASASRLKCWVAVVDVLPLG